VTAPALVGAPSSTATNGDTAFDADRSSAYGGVVGEAASGISATSGQVERWTAFGSGPGGGNPAGVWFGDRLPMRRDMQRIAQDVGYSETAFLESTPDPRRWVVRYFSPGREIDFCGHATIASAVALERRHGSGTFRLATMIGEIPVDVARDGDTVTATLTSVEPERRDLDPEFLDEVLDAMSLTREHLDRGLQPDLAYAGAWHLVLPLRSREDLARLHYDFDGLARLMTREQLTTVQAIWREHTHRFHARNPFPVGGVVEDPATGAAAAALGGYLRIHHHVNPPAELTVIQGVDMGRPSAITVHVPTSGGIGIAGTASEIAMLRDGAGRDASEPSVRWSATPRKE
jgi:PhzF family phenazine biosynthesis protein